MRTLHIPKPIYKNSPDEFEALVTEQGLQITNQNNELTCFVRHEDLDTLAALRHHIGERFDLDTSCWVID